MRCKAWLLLYVQGKNCSARCIVRWTFILLRLLYLVVITTDAVRGTHLQHKAGKIYAIFFSRWLTQGCANAVFENEKNANQRVMVLNRT